MRVAALYDIHGNLPALEAVIHEVRNENVDHIVVGGDVMPGPMSQEALHFLLDLDQRVRFIHGNGEREILALLNGVNTGTVPERFRAVMQWVAQQIDAEESQIVAGWPPTTQLEIAGLGRVLFCHATPHSDTQIFTRLTPDEALLPVFADTAADLVVCGHTHMQFDRTIGNLRVVNAGSVGMPFGEPGAYWLLLGPDIQFRHTRYDLDDAARRIRATRYPQAGEFADQNILQPPTEEAMLAAFSKAALH